MKWQFLKVQDRKNPKTKHCHLITIPDILFVFTFLEGMQARAPLSRGIDFQKKKGGRRPCC